MHLEKLSDRGGNRAAEKPLQLTHPDLYFKLKQELESYHLHSYDVKAGGIPDDEGITIFLRYGDNLSYLKECRFNWLSLKEKDDDLRSFFRETGEDIKKALIADYFKMMKS